MPTVPVLKPREVVKALQRLGWEVARQRGSHIILTKSGHIATLSVPNHREVARGTLQSLIARAGLSVEVFLDALNSCEHGPWTKPDFSPVDPSFDIVHVHHLASAMRRERVGCPPPQIRSPM